MNKNVFVKKMMEKTGLSKKEIYKFMDCFSKTVIEGLNEDEKVSIQPLGIFILAHKKSRKGKNPKTGEDLIIPAYTTPKLKFSRNIKGQLK